MRDLTAVVLAGGRGTRIAHLVPDMPKPLVPVAGKPFLEWLTLFLMRHGLKRFVYSTGYKAEQIEAWTKSAPLPGATTETVAEPAALGTGGAIFGCLDHCGEWFLALNGDSLAIFDVTRLTGFAGGDVDCVIAGLPVADASRYGSLDVGADGHLLGFREKQPGAGLINAGFYLFRKAALLPFVRPGQVSLETEVLPAMIAAGLRVSVLDIGKVDFIDIGTPETLTAADEFIGSRAHLFEVR
jgi:NDP-sugar pyrophosphorylase family protein